MHTVSTTIESLSKVRLLASMQRQRMLQTHLLPSLVCNKIVLGLFIDFILFYGVLHARLFPAKQQLVASQHTT